MEPHLRTLDGVAILLYLAGMMAIALYFARRNTNTEDDFFGNRGFSGSVRAARRCRVPCPLRFRSCNAQLEVPYDANADVPCCHSGWGLPGRSFGFGAGVCPAATCAGHLFEAAIAYYEATGKRILLDVACRFADHIDTVFRPGRKIGYSGQREIAVADIAAVTKRQDYLYASIPRFRTMGSTFIALKPITESCEGRLP